MDGMGDPIVSDTTIDACGKRRRRAPWPGVVGFRSWLLSQCMVNKRERADPKQWIQGCLEWWCGRGDVVWPAKALRRWISYAWSQALPGVGFHTPGESVVWPDAAWETMIGLGFHTTGCLKEPSQVQVPVRVRSSSFFFNKGRGGYANATRSLFFVLLLRGWTRATLYAFAFILDQITSFILVYIGYFIK